jgi:hypothetical protein
MTLGSVNVGVKSVDELVYQVCHYSTKCTSGWCTWYNRGVVGKLGVLVLKMQGGVAEMMFLGFWKVLVCKWRCQNVVMGAMA